MSTIKVFIDTSTVNRILRLNLSKLDDMQYEEDRKYLSEILEKYVKPGIVQLLVNPSVEMEIQKTEDALEKERLLGQFHQFHFTPFNKTVFPFKFPATFLVDDEKKMLEALREYIPSMKTDVKIFADVVFNSEIDILLTTNKKHFKKKKFYDFLERSGLNKRILVFMPQELFEYLERTANQ